MKKGEKAERRANKPHNLEQHEYENMDQENDYIESDARESLIYSLPAPPPSPLHQQGFLNASDKKMRGSKMSTRTGSRCDTLSTKGQRESLADELSSSLAIIAREERRRVGNDSLRSGRQTRGESDEGGDASEESWFSFLGAQSDGTPVVTAATTSSSDDRYTHLSRGRAKSGGDDAHFQGLPTCIDVHGLPMPVDDRVGQSHGNSPALVVAKLPPPQFKCQSGSPSSMPLSGSDKGQSGDEQVPVDRHPHHHRSKRAPSAIINDGIGPKGEDRHTHHHLQHAPSATRTGCIHTKGNHETMDMSVPKAKRLKMSHAAAEDSDGRGSSSGSGTEGGYDASASSPSVSSSEDGQDGDRRRPRKKIMNGLHFRRKHRGSYSLGSSGSMSSELAALSSSTMPTSDFSSIEANRVKLASAETNHQRKRHHAATHVMSRYDTRDVIPPAASNLSSKIQVATQRRHQDHHLHQSLLRENYESALFKAAATEEKPVAYEGAPIFSLGCDVMAHCLTFLEPLEVHSLLTAPLSKQWRNNLTTSQDLWRVLCLMEPFKAKYGPEDLNTDESANTFASQSGPDVTHLFGRYRLLYTSFIRCVRYLNQIKDDAIHGRPPSVLDYGGGGLKNFPLTTNASLRQFLAKARHTLTKNKHQSIAAATLSEPDLSNDRSNSLSAIAAAPVGVSDVNTLSSEEPMKKKAKRESSSTVPRVQYGHSQLTQRLLGPSMDGATPGNVNLPWSCAIYSIVNWMVAFSDVEGIQVMCLKVLPYLLEDEGQRTTAQSAGLTDIVLRGMVVFPDSVELHTAAFHTIVLLARPIGGREGMLFRSSLVNSSGIFNSGSQSGRSGIAVMLDSMQRFENEDILQAMSCWSLVNVALAPSQKSMLVKLGGIAATANAMVQHPYNAEVQFRALFALINLVIPSAGQSDDSSVARELQEQLGDVNQTVEKDMLDERVGQIATLVVQAMKHFCSSESILNRACLVLHNLSLTTEYHTTLLWTPSCYQMLEWCLANYRTDLVLQQSAAGTLHRLQQTLSSDAELRHQFTSYLKSQQQHSLEQAHQEAVLLHEHQEELLTRRSGANA